ncbi:MAG: hypothetical protein M3544_05795, partial [Pseudomonadota bacterium]|nr:hypothetical protein [Pseudomonadota bacterium]
MQKKITPPEHVEICGVPVSTVDRSHVLRQMTRTIDSRKPGNFISITNTESMYHALRTGAHMDFVRKATHSLAVSGNRCAGEVSGEHPRA